MAIGDEQILPAVVIVVKKAGAPAEERDRGLGDARLVADIGEVGVAVVAIERLVVVGKDRVVEDRAGRCCDSRRRRCPSSGLAAVLVEA